MAERPPETDSLRERVLEALSECDTDRDRADEVIREITQDVQRRIAEALEADSADVLYGCSKFVRSLDLTSPQEGS